MKIKVTSTIILNTERIDSKFVRASIEREVIKKGSDRIARLWAWDEANKQEVPDITLELLFSLEARARKRWKWLF